MCVLLYCYYSSHVINVKHSLLYTEQSANWSFLLCQMLSSVAVTVNLDLQVQGPSSIDLNDFTCRRLSIEVNLLKLRGRHGVIVTAVTHDKHVTSVCPSNEFV